MTSTTISHFNLQHQGKFCSALQVDKSLIYLTKTISTKFELAETYYMLGLTYQKKGHFEKSQANFQEAMRLFQQIDAPTHVEKVQRSMEHQDKKAC